MIGWEEILTLFVYNNVDNFDPENLQVKFISFIFVSTKTNKMAIKQTDIRLMELKSKLVKFNDRATEILGEKTTLMFKLENGHIHPILCLMKVHALDFEMCLINEEVNELKTEFDTIEMVSELNIDFSPEDF